MSLPSRYSTACVSAFMPVISEKPAARTPPDSTRKLKLTKGSFGRRGISTPSQELLLDEVIVHTHVPQGLAANWENRRITNSAGFTTARPTSVMTRPRSTDSGGLVSASHFT